VQQRAREQRRRPSVRLSVRPTMRRVHGISPHSLLLPSSTSSSSPSSSSFFFFPFLLQSSCLPPSLLFCSLFYHSFDPPSTLSNHADRHSLLSRLSLTCTPFSSSCSSHIYFSTEPCPQPYPPRASIFLRLLSIIAWSPPPVISLAQQTRPSPDPSLDRSRARSPPHLPSGDPRSSTPFTRHNCVAPRSLPLSPTLNLHSTPSRSLRCVLMCLPLLFALVRFAHQMFVTPSFFV